MQNERDLTLKVGEVLGQLVQEIKEMKAQLQCVSADIALQSKVLGQIRMDRSCRMLGGRRAWSWWCRSRWERYGSVPISIRKALVLFLA